MQGQNGPIFGWSIGRTQHLYNFASPRRNLRDGATYPASSPNRTHRTRPRFWGPNSHTCLSSGLEVQITQTIHIRLAHTRPSRYRCMSSICLLDSTDTVFIHPYTLALQCTMWIIRPSGLLNLSVQAYSRSSSTTLDPSARTFRSTFTAFVDRHVASCA